MKNQKNYFVDNKKFYDAIVQHYVDCEEAQEKGLEQPRIPEFIGECLLKIADNLTRHRWFINYTQQYKEEMVGQALLNCIEYFYRFDANRFSNPFSYFTQSCFNTFRDVAKKERRNQYVKYASFEKAMIESGGDGLTELQMYDNISEFIANFEDDVEKERVKRKEKLAQKKRLEEQKDSESSSNN